MSRNLEDERTAQMEQRIAALEAENAQLLESLRWAVSRLKSWGPIAGTLEWAKAEALLKQGETK